MKLSILDKVPCAYNSENDSICAEFKDSVIYGDPESILGGQMITAEIKLSQCLIDKSTCSSEQQALLSKAETGSLFTEFWAKHK